jgi:hypothetical protein
LQPIYVFKGDGGFWVRPSSFPNPASTSIDRKSYDGKNEWPQVQLASIGHISTLLKGNFAKKSGPVCARIEDGSERKVEGAEKCFLSLGLARLG